MNRTEVSRLLATVRIELIESKLHLKEMIEHPDWRGLIELEKDNSKELLQTLDFVMNYLKTLEKEFSHHRRYRRK